MPQRSPNVPDALRIERLVQGGYGLARSGGGIILISLSAPGDLLVPRFVKRQRGVLFGEVGDLLEPSPCRVEPHCPLYGECGGCQLMHIRYEDQVRLKAGAVV